MDNNLNNQIAKAAKWSTISEVIARVVSPLIQIVLARLLTPEAFGVVATVTMVISFAELFTEAGFQKFIIQHRFNSDSEKNEYATVAFWANFVMSLFIWVVILVFSKKIAALVGSPGLSIAIVVASFSLVLNSFSSIQSGLFKRDLNYKFLFKTRIASVSVPFLVTIPIAIFLRSYWALIIGTLALSLTNAIILFFSSKWKPTFFFSFKLLKRMLSFTIWTLFETISIWLTTNVDIFIIGQYLSSYYVGLYKVSLTTVSQITNIIVATASPILFSSLSRVQNKNTSFNQLFLKFQKLTAIVVFPICFAILCYKDLIVSILLGSQWGETAGFIGLWGASYGITITICYLGSEAYRAKGWPKLSTFVQLIHIVFLIPVMIYSAQNGYKSLYIWRTVLVLQFAISHLIALKMFIGIPCVKVLLNIAPSFFAATVSVLLYFFLDLYLDGFLLYAVSLILYFSLYCCFLTAFKRERIVLRTYYYRIKRVLIGYL